ncbi:hypothetical protein GPK88_01930 [Blautia sp. MCC269]|nr:hypothetical protein [Blautia sp. MCC269]
MYDFMYRTFEKPVKRRTVGRRKVMGDRIRANISTMSREFADMENLQKAAQNSLDELVNAIHALNGSWEGMAHDALVSVFNSDQESMQETLRLLGEYISALVAAQNEYQNCEQQVESRISSIRV